MARGPSRKFRLLDAIVLIAATAIGFAWLRSDSAMGIFDGPSWIETDAEQLGPLLAVWSIAVLGLRLVPPRPPLRRVVLQPGAAACGAVAFVFTIYTFRYLVISAAGCRGIPWYLFRAGGGLGPEMIGNTIVSVPYHVVVMAVWGVLFLSRRCRPEPSWIDRTGRILGLAWILLALWLWVDYAISEWNSPSNVINAP